MNFLYPHRMSITVSMPMAFIYAKSWSHSFSPQFWCGMSCDISSRNVPVMRSPLSFGTISPPADVSSDDSAPLSDEHDVSNEGATRADAPPIAMVFRKSLRSLIFELVNYFKNHNCKYNYFSYKFILLLISFIVQGCRSYFI